MSRARPFVRDLVLFFVSLALVGLGQPALLSELCPLAATIGFALFFLSCSPLTKKEKVCRAFLWFACVQGIQLFWMNFLEFQTGGIVFVYLLILVCLGIQFGVFALALTSRLSWGQIAGCASLWALIEWSRLHVGCGFTWNPIGLTLSYSPFSLQWAGVLGVIGLSFWVMGTNLIALKGMQERKKIYLIPFFVVASLPYLFGMGVLAKKKEKEGSSFRVALVQTDWLPYEKTPRLDRIDAFLPPLKQWKAIIQQMSLLQKDSVDLIVLPEAALSFFAKQALFPLSSVRELFSDLALVNFVEQEVFPSFSPPYATFRLGGEERGIYVNHLFIAQIVANYFGSDLIIGLDHAEEKNHFNSAFYIQKGREILGRYDKQILLPLAEASPPSWLKPWLARYGLITFFTPGSQGVLWDGKVALAPSICYEDTFSHLFWKAHRRGAQLFVNVTNDNYYPNSNLFKQHLFHARIRAVENGIPLIRACNGGGSSVIDSNGKIEMYTTKGAELIISQVHLSNYHTIFSYYGEIGIVTSCFVILGFYLLGLLRDFLEANKGIGLVLSGSKK